MIPEATIEAILDRAPIEEVVKRYFPLKKSGPDFFAPCPFHAEKTGSFHVSPAKRLFYCLGGETEAITRSGIFPLRDLSGSNPFLLGGNGQWIKAPVRSFGNQMLHKITLSRSGKKKVIRATREHRWFKKRVELEVTTAELKPGDYLESVKPPTLHTCINLEGIRAGIVFGDGNRQGEWSSLVIYKSSDKQDLIPWFSGYETKANDWRAGRLPYDWKSLPRQRSLEFKASWVAGLFAVDGHISKRDGSVILTQHKESSIRLVESICNELGWIHYGVTRSEQDKEIRGRKYKNHEMFRILLSPRSLPGWFFFRAKHSLANKTRQERLRWKVESIEPDRIEEVFCATVDGVGSFVLNDYIKTGNCFGCGAGGNAINFVMQHDGLNFPEACRILGERFGVPVEFEESPEEKRLRQERQRRERDLEAIQTFFSEGIQSSGDLASRFLYEKGFGVDPEFLDQWGIGFGRSKGPRFVGEFRESKSDEVGPARRFKDRLTFAIRDAQGRLVGWSGRTLVGHKAKYVNSSNSEFFNKSKLLFGLDLAIRSILRNEIVNIVEGQTDVIALHLAGYPNTVAALGTSFTESHASILSRYCKRACLIYDGDQAGRGAARRTFRILAGFGFHVRALLMPSGKDPGDVFLEDASRLNTANALPFLELLASDLPEDPGEQVKAIRELGELCSEIQDTTLRRKTAELIAMKLNVTVKELRVSSSSRSDPRNRVRFRYLDELALAIRGDLPEELGSYLEGEEGEFTREVSSIGATLAASKFPQFAGAVLIASTTDTPEDLLRAAQMEKLSEKVRQAREWEDLETALAEIQCLIST